MSSSVIKPLLLFILLFSGVKSNSQVNSLYNWKGTHLPLYEKPDINSRILINIPKGEAVQKTGNTTVLPSFNIILSYYGSMAPPEVGDVYKSGGTWYNMPGTWVQVNYHHKTGYVPGPFLSRLPDLLVHKMGVNEYENITAAYMSAFFGPPVSKRKKELPKQDKEEINYKKTYHYKNGSYCIASFAYAEEGGAGNETYTLFLKGLNEHEALMLLLKITSFNNIMTDQGDGIKKRVISKSLYDQFQWWYNKGLTKDEKVEGNIDKEFFYSQEGGMETVTLKETKDGVIISYSFGRC